MELRGFDSYPIMLGDEMRGERASLGKSLDDVERDLLIKKRMIVAIENCNLEGFPNRSVVAGYVRAYARYLGMDAEDAYHRFCAESGYQSPSAMVAERAGASGRGALPLLPGRAGPDLALSRFAAPPTRSRFMAAIPLGAITSTAALLTLMSGLAYGGWALLQDIQRVGFAPVPAAPTVVAEAPLITAPSVAAADVPLPDPSAYRDGGILAAVAAPEPLMPVEALRRDGPISAIDPRVAGVFAPEPEDEIRTAEAPPIDSADDAIRAAVLKITDETDAEEATAEAETAAPGDEAMPGGETVLASMDAEETLAGEKSVLLHASEEAWIRVRDRDNVIFEGILTAGQQYELPARIEAPMLKAGNAGGVFVVVDGVAYGPLGPRGQVARDVSLTPDAIRGSMPQAASLNLVSAGPVELHQSAEAATVQQ